MRFLTPYTVPPKVAAALKAAGKEMTPGDTTLTWAPGNEAETALAEDAFEAAKDAGFCAFLLKGDRGRGKQISAFDKHAGKMLLIPPIAGG